MQYINTNILCLTYDELVPSFMLADTYQKNRTRGNIVVHGLGGNGRKVLIEFESLPEKYQTAIKAKYGNPYEYLAKQPILDLIDWDLKAQQFYNDYVLPNGDKLPNTNTNAKGKPQINYVERYTKAASWLTAIDKLTTDKRALKQLLNLTVMDFWDTVSELIIKENVCIPANRKRLIEKVQKFKAIADTDERYQSLIDVSKFGNDRTALIKGEECKGVLYKMLTDGRHQDYTVVRAAYNIWAKANKKPTVSDGAIGYFARENAHIIQPMLMGMKKAYSKYTKQIHREPTKAPLLFANADDNILDLFFEQVTYNKEGKKKVNKYYRPALYIIIDTYNDYILGYAIGDTVTTELIYAAWRNAIEHIYELTGGYYLPQQLQTDRWGLDVKLKNKLTEFYKMVGGKFTVQSQGIPQGKVIEQSFGGDWHQVLKVMPSDNYAGYNITAKQRISQDYILDASKNYPSIDEVPKIVHQFITIMRLKGNPKTKISRQTEWIEAFNNSEISKKRQIDTGLKLDIVGVKRVGEPLKITSAGLKFSLNNQKYVLDVPDNVIYEHNGKGVDIIYNPTKMDEFLVTDGKGLRFVTGLYQNRPMAIADYKEGSRLQLEADWSAKKQITTLMATTVAERIKSVSNVDTQGLLQAGLLQKDLKNEAEANYLAQIFGGANLSLLPPRHLGTPPKEGNLPNRAQKALTEPKAHLPAQQDDDIDIRDFY